VKSPASFDLVSRLLARSNGLSAIAIVASLILPQAARVVRRPTISRREIATPQADLYLPPGGPWPAIVLVLGALREGRRYPLLEGTARSIASCGFAVLVPELGRLRRLILADDALDDLVAAVLALQAEEGVARAPAGLIGFSLGGSLALVAAADDRLRNRVACVASMGGYFSLTDMLTAATTGTIETAGAPSPLAAPAVFAIAASLVAPLSSPDRELLERALEESRDVPLEALSRIDTGSVAPQARAVLNLLKNRDPHAVASLIGDVGGAAEMMARFSPETVAGRIDVPVWVLHDERDQYVPAQQSRRMRDALAGRTNFKFFALRLLEHTEPRAPGFSPVRILHDYLPGLFGLVRFAHGPVKAVRSSLSRVTR
jgi:dienelactone hydrolase